MSGLGQSVRRLAAAAGPVRRARGGWACSSCSRRLGTFVVLAAMALTSALVGGARLADAASWRLAPAEAPPPPPGVAPAPYPLPLGQVGELSFWAPNRGLLITGGSEATGGPVPAGLYAYNGRDWHQLASVCGGAEGRIAWAGPDEFWTIADQRAGQLVARQQSDEALHSVSLCHFLDGRVVGSYAMPLEQPDSYLHMDAAACYGPSDCWFGGQDGSAPNFGAFHLHWDGSTVSAVYEPWDHAVTDMVNFAGELYESVQIEGADVPLPEESLTNPAVIHKIAPAGVEPTFAELVIFSESEGVDLPDYGKDVLPAALQGFGLATDGSPLGAGATQLWAAANPVALTPSNSQAASVTVLRDTEGNWLQLTPDPQGQSLLPAGTTLGGAEHTQVNSGSGELAASGAIAPEPGSEGAWLSLRDGSAGAEVGYLEVHPPQKPGEAEARLVETDQLPSSSEAVGLRGEAGPIACPAPHDCWMATTSARGSAPGWLFHLTGSGADPAQTEGYPEDTDPNFTAVIASRPPDSGVPTIYPDLPPADDSLANQQQAPPAPSGPPESAPSTAGRHGRTKPLIEHLKSRLLHHRVLVISFTLTARAHVQLLARRRRRVVASTRREALRAGSHRLSLSLDPAHWPTGLQFKASPVGVTAPSGGEPETNDTVET